MRNMSVCFPTHDLDIIQEVISEDRERTFHNLPSGSCLPGPPSPPDHQKQTPRTMPRQPASSSPPVLVPRGTAPVKAPHSFPQPQSASRGSMAAQPSRGASQSGALRRGRGSSASVASRGPVGPAPQAQGDTALLERILEQPRLLVVEEPKERGMRFRYECEGRSAGSILGTSSTDTKKTLPAVEIHGPIQHVKKVRVTVSLVTKDIPHRPHPHCLVGKDCAEGTGICVVSFNPHKDRCHSFANLGVQCIRRKELDASLERRRSLNIDPFKTGHSKSIEDMDMNVVRLCFQCELEGEDGSLDELYPVVSQPIYDKKATTTSELKINRLNEVKGSCTGKTEIYMLCDKVQKDDIEIIFKRGSWEAKAEFAQTDVHRQIAIVFKSPPYQEQDITEEQDVSVFLRRLSDHMDSEPVTFTYLPHNPDPYEVNRKRKIKKDISFSERSCVAAQSLAASDSSSSSKPFESFVYPAEPCVFPDEVNPSAQTGSSSLGEMQYGIPLEEELLCSLESYTFLNQLLEDPSLQAMLSNPGLTSSLTPVDLHGFSLGPNANFANLDANFNPSQIVPEFGQQDVAYYNDMQLQIMVNQYPPTEVSDSNLVDMDQHDNEGVGGVSVKVEKGL
ncbi:transcription factor RelB [Osmerus mordax]|uniref:transcription factor RelB n=1 Tax=Osmerus mordax TaxID=8014 RepID=UPI00350ECD19